MMKTQSVPVSGEELKEKRNRTLEEKKSHKEMQEHIDLEVDRLLTLKKTSEDALRPKSDKVFRNHYKNFQYDYEEDFYEPKYGDDEE